MSAATHLPPFLFAHVSPTCSPTWTHSPPFVEPSCTLWYWISASFFFFLLGKAARDVACCRDSAKLSRLCKLLNMWGRVRCKTCLTEVLEMHLSHFRRVSMQFLCRTNAFILPVSSPLWSQQQLLCNYSDRRSLNGPRILVMPRGFCSACCLCVCTQ